MYSRTRSTASPETTANSAPTKLFQRSRCTAGKSDGRAHGVCKGLLPLPRSSAHVYLATSRMERYSHIRMEAQRRAVDDLSGTDFAPGVAQNWAQFFVSEKSDEANSLKTSGEPGRTRTSNPLIKSQSLAI